MKNRLLLLLVISIFLPAFVQAQLTDEVFVHNGLNRTYKLYIPEGLPPSSPLVFVLHGYSGNAANTMANTDMNSVADANGFAVCYPQGTVDFTGITHWNIEFSNDPIDDVGFLTSLATELQLINGFDPACTYVCGMSNGGMMSYYLGCEASDTFSAFASVAGTITESFLASCLDNITVPFIHFHGTGDIIVPYNGGGPLPDLWSNFLGVEYIMKKWYQANNCSSLSVENIPNAPVVDYSSVKKYQLDDCNGGLKARLYKIDNGGHTWPGAPPAGFFDFIQPTNQDIDASVEIWNFFSSVCSPSGLAMSREAEFPAGVKFYPNPVSGPTYADVTGAEEALLKVFSISGALILTRELQQGQNQLDISSLAPGIYLTQTVIGAEQFHSKLIIE